MAVTPRDVRYFALTVALAVLFVGGYVLATELTRPPPPHAPPLAVTTLDGTTVDPAHWRGEVVVLDFFATWCTPCHTVADHLVALREELGPEAFRVLGIGVDPDEDLERLEDHRAERALPWIVGKADEEDVAAYGVTALAHLVVLDREGRIVAELSGSPALSEIRDAVRRAGA